MNFFISTGVGGEGGAGNDSLLAIVGRMGGGIIKNDDAICLWS